MFSLRQLGRALGKVKSPIQISVGCESPLKLLSTSFKSMDQDSNKKVLTLPVEKYNFTPILTQQFKHKNEDSKYKRGSILPFASSLAVAAVALSSNEDKSENMPVVKFVYFDIQAKGELIRLLLAAGNFDYEDKRVAFSEWPGDIKDNTPFGQIPVLYWDGEELAQAMAMARFVARKVGLAGNTDMEFAKADMVMCHYEEIWKKLPKMKFAKTQAEREELAREFLTEFLPAWLPPMEAILEKQGGGWFAGDGATFADIAIMCALDFIQAEEEMSFKDMNNVEERRKILDAYPLLKENYLKTCALPFVVEWKKKRPAFAGF